MPRDLEHPWNVAIFGSYNAGSVGDKLILICLLKVLRKILPGSKVTVYCHAVENIRAELNSYGIKCDCVPVAGIDFLRRPIASIGFCASRILRRIQGAMRVDLPFLTDVRLPLAKIARHDLLIVGGGNLLMDYYKHWPRLMHRFLLRARQQDVPYAFIGVGAMPISSEDGKATIGKCLDRARSVVVRDNSSALALAEIYGCRARIAPDLGVWALVDEDLSQQPSFEPLCVPRVVGVNICTLFGSNWPDKSPQKYDIWLRSLRDNIVTVWKEYQCSFHFIHTNYPSDSVAVRDLLPMLVELGVPPESIVHHDYLPTLRELMQNIDAVDIVVSTRLHCGIASLARRKPVVAIAYQPKVECVLREIDESVPVISVDELAASASMVHRSVGRILLLRRSLVDESVYQESADGLIRGVSEAVHEMLRASAETETW